MNLLAKLLMTALVVLLAASYPAAAEDVAFREDFESLADWKPLFFPKIKEHTEYSIESDESGSYLRLESEDSASALIHAMEFNVYDYPLVRWRWKVRNVISKGNALKKSGDDYPIRVFVMFKYEPDGASILERIKYDAIRRKMGEYTPMCSLSYMWASRDNGMTVIKSPYSKHSRMIPLDIGEDGVGSWKEHEVNILADHRMAFGYDPPERAMIAVMADTDNTGVSAISFLDYIEVFRR